MIQASNNAVKKRIEREKGDAVLMANRAGIVPDAWQSDLLRSDARQMILLCSRQSGKSTVSAVLGLTQPVSYTGLRMPTILRVWICCAAE